MRYRRVVAKCGTSLLTAGSDRLDLEAMSAIVGQVVRLRAAGHEVVVVSSGARAAGRHAIAHLPAKHRPPGKQALASIGQHRLMATWGMLFDAYDIVVAQVLLTRRDLSDRLAYLNARNTLRELMELRRGAQSSTRMMWSPWTRCSPRKSARTTRSRHRSRIWSRRTCWLC